MTTITWELQQVAASIHLTQQEIDAFLGPVLRTHPTWTTEDAWRVAFANGVEAMRKSYQTTVEDRAAQRPNEVVGYSWTSEAGHLSSYHCLQHRPTPPDDGTPVMACDVTDETCEQCGDPLSAS